MKTRIVYPRMWLDEKLAATSTPTKLLFCYLINNLQLGLSRYLHITDRQILFDTGLTVNQLATGKEELSDIGWCYFTENWVYQNHTAAYVDYGGRDRVVKAKEQEEDNVPQRVKEVFNGLLTGSEPVLNHKSETLNPKPKTKGGVGGKKPEHSQTYLTNIPPADIEAFGREYNIHEDAVVRKGRDLSDWCESTGKSRKDYKAFLRVTLSKDSDSLRQRFGAFVSDEGQYIDPAFREMLGMGGAS